MKIETARLTIRPWATSDLASLFKLSKDIGYLGFASPGFLQFPNESEARAYLEKRAALFSEKGLGKFPLFLKATGDCVGTCGFDSYRIEGRDEIELGYRIALKHWYQGLATEAARALVDYGFGGLGRKHLFAFAVEQNRGSIKVLEKLGFSRRGTLMHADYEHFLFEKHKEKP